jgi:hypothetical protein
MNYYDRLVRSGPTGKLVADIIDSLIDAVNEVIGIVTVGQAPHKVNDTTNVIAGVGATGLDSVIDLSQEEITKYEAHIGSTTFHVVADSTNVVTEVGVPIEIYALLDELKVDYEAHRILTAGSVHAGTDAVNLVTAANATTKALAILLANDLRTQFIANYANVTAHHGADGSADAPTVAALVPGTATWTEIAALADDLRASYEAHRVNLAGGIHGLADGTNTVTATAIGVVTTAAYAGQNELKGDFNAHIAESGTSHYMLDNSMAITVANASTNLTSIALANALKTAVNDHISRAEEAALGSLLNLRDREEDRLRR